VFFFHGLPGSRTAAGPIDDEARAAGVRVIAPDRPGFGLSDFQPGRRLLDWPADVCELAEALGIQRFAVAGVSGGAPHALACAYAIPGRLTGCAAISSIAPFDALGEMDGLPLFERVVFGAAHHASAPVVRACMRVAAGFARRAPRLALNIFKLRMPPADRNLWSRNELLRWLRPQVREAFRQGGRASAWEAGIVTRSWGFDLRDIRVPVRVWHGDGDATAPVAFGRYLARVIPGAQLRVLPGGGHQAYVEHAQEIFGELARAE
jgi:pimeloyl-ACP methyl ester carboxylesterase